jgi:hypothetical protein
MGAAVVPEPTVALDALLAELRFRCVDCIEGEGGCQIEGSRPRQWCDACLVDAVIAAAARGDTAADA